MIILPVLPVFFTGSYLTYIFLLMFVFGLLFQLMKGVLS